MNTQQTMNALFVMLKKQALAGQVMNYRQTYKDSLTFMAVRFVRGLPFALQYVKRYLDRAMLGGTVEDNVYMYPKFAAILTAWTHP